MTPFVALGLDGIWLFSAQSIDAEGLNLRCHQPLGLQRLGPGSKIKVRISISAASANSNT